MRTVWKFLIRVTDVQVIQMPARAIILSVQEQRGELCLWAEVETERAPTSRTIEMFGTGERIQMRDIRAFIGTVQQLNGAAVWHVYERTTNNASLPEKEAV